MVEEIKAAKLYSIMTDEVTSHNKEQLALCARFIDKNNVVREDFIAFIHLPRITGEVIAETIVSTLQGLGLEIENVRVQGYDGAANMSSDNVGVQRRIRERSPKAVYVHCSSHCLNLVISHSRALPQIRAQAEKGIARHIDASSVVWNRIDNGKLANQIARLAAIAVKYSVATVYSAVTISHVLLLS